MTSYTQHRFHALDGMRGIAALLVMMYHYYQDTSFRIFHNAFMAVDFFFILSGFVICHAYRDKIMGGLCQVHYVACRLGRLWPLAATGILLGLPAFWIMNMPGQPGSQFTLQNVISGVIGNLFFIPDMGNGSPYLTDGPLWSISCELLVSLAFLFLVRLPASQLLKVCRACLCVLLVAAAIRGPLTYGYLNINMGWHTDHVFAGYARAAYGFTCGMLIYAMRDQLVPSRLLNWLDRLPVMSTFNLYMALLVVLLFPSRIQGLYCFLLVIVLAPWLVMQGSKITAKGGHMHGRLERASELLGWISYPLYCVHSPAYDTIKVLRQMGYVGEAHEREIAIGLSLVLAITIGLALDRLKVQQRLSGILSHRLRSWFAA